MIRPHEILKRIREEKPLIHHITNNVTIYDCAGITRAFGALPVMAPAIEESGEMASVSSALVLNIGTLTPRLVESMLAAGRNANKKGIPVILDAVGAGATKLRTESTLELMKKLRIAVLKGNAGEIAAIAGAKSEVRGVESMGVAGDIRNIAKNLALKTGSVVAVTGREDIVTDGRKTYLVDNGHSLMGEVVGTGCMAGSAIGAFCSVEKKYAKAAASALACFGIAGELAAAKARGPGSFRSLLHDEVYRLNEKKTSSKMRVREF
ncbi:MAG: hydroxyethylthiazole kinase [Candidatus Altiarchaeota archaeon]|nr:hydroxyethylthiazole kinase [Candidatus Altiarchaeota archaeon]